VSRILERINGTLHRRTEFRSAVSILRRHLDIRVRPDLFGDEPDGAGAPWASMGGALHLTDLEHGGYSGRSAFFIVGLDADALPGGDVQDPVLLDSDRRVLGRELPTASEVSRERAFRFAALFARLRGRVTLSHCAWDPTEARTLGPSSLMLQALRASRGQSDLTFEDLHGRLGRVVNAMPAAGRIAIDGEDWWMRALGSGAVMRYGVDSVRASFPLLDAGLSAQHERHTGPPGPVHGVITPRPSELDPRVNERTVVSASRLEALGACPLRYLHDSVLRIRIPDDPELDPDAWLDPRTRGSLLHAVFDRVMRASKDGGIRPEDRAFEELASEALDAGIARLRLEVPSPGEGTLARETAALHEDVRSFVRMIREQLPEPVALELRFGLGEDEPVVLRLDGGPLRMRGAIDRVDQDLAGLHVVDYKTGTAFGHGKNTFNGGRRLQHGVYAHAAQARLSLDVIDGQYHFPTRRGQNQSFIYDRLCLTSLPDLLDTMLDGVAQGRFVPTDSAEDCKFCDFAEVCRVSKGDYGKIDSPMAEWSEQVGNVGLWPAFEQLKKSRAWED
jgi:ATP-dependent helicase/nuclease subunit B